MLVVTRGHTYLGVWLRMYDLLLPSGIEGLEGILEIFEEKSDEMRSVLSAVPFEKAVLKTFTKFLENHPRQNTY